MPLKNRQVHILPQIREKILFHLTWHIHPTFSKSDLALLQYCLVQYPQTYFAELARRQYFFQNSKELLPAFQSAIAQYA